ARVVGRQRSHGPGHPEPAVRLHRRQHCWCEAHSASPSSSASSLATYPLGTTGVGGIVRRRSCSSVTLLTRSSSRGCKYTWVLLIEACRKIVCTSTSEKLGSAAMRTAAVWRRSCSE